jgi:hypothetical protein
MKYIIIGVAALIVFAWLSFSVLPDKGVATLSPLVQGESLNGPVFAVVSTSIKGKLRNTKIVQSEKWRHVTNLNTGWDAVIAWWPFALVTALIGGTGGWFLGRMLQDDDYAEGAHKTIKEHGYKLERAEAKLSEAKNENSLAKQTKAEAEKLKKAAQNIEERAASQVEEANGRARGAEGKLEKERTDHKNRLDKINNLEKIITGLKGQKANLELELSIFKEEAIRLKKILEDNKISLENEDVLS